MFTLPGNWGRVAEWLNASVLKTDVLQGTGGSNPSSSDSIVWVRSCGIDRHCTIEGWFLRQHRLTFVLSKQEGLRWAVLSPIDR